MSIKTTFKIKKDGETFRVFDNEQMIMQGFLTTEMALHGLWSYMGKRKASHYRCDDSGKVFVTTEEIG